MQELPEAWRELSDYHRDILFTVYQDGGRTGKDVFETIGRCDGRAQDTRFYDRLGELIESGHIRTEPAEDDGRARVLHITAKGDLLVETVAEKWRGL